MNDSTAAFRLPTELKKSISRYAKKINISPSKLIRRAIEKEIDKLVEIERLVKKLNKQNCNCDD